MPNYDWTEYQNRPWLERFPEGVRGLDVWRELPLEGSPDSLNQERGQTTARLVQPCVFVSHRRADLAQAMRIAYLACQEGFDYWLDVLDPQLGPFAPPKSGAAIAAIIEMALLNSTHVMAVMTRNTKGSQWVPYEYGRVKAPMPVTLQAASWLDKSLAAPDIPEYLHLGAITRSEAEIRTWLQAERQRYGSPARPLTLGWSRAIPGPL